MPKTKYKVMSVMFDIKPTNDFGEVDVSRISKIQTVVNVGRKFRITKKGMVRIDNLGYKQKNTKDRNALTVEVYKEIKETGRSKTNEQVPSPQSEFEGYLNQEIDFEAELSSMGAKVFGSIDIENQFLSKTTQTIVYEKNSPDHDLKFQKALSQINQKISSEQNEVFFGEPKKIDAFSLGILTKYENDPVVSHELQNKISNYLQDSQKKSKFKFTNHNITFLIISLGFMGLVAFGSYGVSLKNEVEKEGNLAVKDLESAGENIKNFDFFSASDNFSKAYKEFSKASQGLNFLGVGISSLLADLPGAGKLRSAKNLVEVGKLMANAGQAMSDAMSELSKTNLILSPVVGKNDSDVVHFGQISESLKNALVLSQKNLKSAKVLLLEVDRESIPEDKRSSFDEFNSKLPVFEGLVDDSVGYSKFLEDFIGTRGEKKYLILFQNQSELRPTGGFPGTYGVISFKDGKLHEFKVDDIYNLDGQLEELFVPPLQLQHIVPNWAMRDVNWFVDFPTSAKKVIEFYKKESGENVDGVVTFSPKIVGKMLDIVGEVSMPEYGFNLNSKNLIPTLQEEVEYRGDRKQPKKVIVDLAPKILSKLYSADPDKWLEIFNVLMIGMEEKDILMYFRDLNLQSFSVDNGFSGQISNTKSDYLMVTLTNIKGSKTDSVTDSSIKIKTYTEIGGINHKVSITRKHNGGGSKYGFYNKQSPSYVRVLIPKDSEFSKISGNSKPNFQPLLNYKKTDFKRDQDLVKFEASGDKDEETGVTVYEEAGKKELGFWMILDPGQTKTVEFEYFLPTDVQGDFELYLQKQPGLEIDDLKFYMDDELYFEGPLNKDMVVKSSSF